MAGERAQDLIIVVLPVCPVRGKCKREFPSLARAFGLTGLTSRRRVHCRRSARGVGGENKF
ncbi:hypothetical protein F7234_01450 [Pseudomonas putida]|nr:hypothetical protein F7234_01450 [Pseudomonas putida]